MSVDPGAVLDHKYLLRMVGTDGNPLPDEIQETPQAALDRVDGNPNVATADVWYFEEPGQPGEHVFTITADGDMITDQELGSQSEPSGTPD